MEYRYFFVFDNIWNYQCFWSDCFSFACEASLAAWVITDILPVDVSIVSPLAGNDLFLCALFGGIISGCGSGLTIRFGGAIDGIDIVAVMFAKKIGISIGNFVMIYNVLLYIICGIIIGSWTLLDCDICSSFQDH